MVKQVTDAAISELDNAVAGQPISARKYNRVIDAVQRITKGVAPIRQIVNDPSQGGTGGKSAQPTGVWYGDSPLTPNDNILYEMDLETMSMNPGRFVFLSSNFIVGTGGNKKVVYVAQSVGVNEFDDPFRISRINAETLHIVDTWDLPREWGSIVGVGGDENIVIVFVDRRSDSLHFVLYLDPNNVGSDGQWALIGTPHLTEKYGFEKARGGGGDSSTTYVIGGGGQSGIYVSINDTQSRTWIGRRLYRIDEDSGQETAVDCGGDRENLFVAGEGPRRLYHYKVINRLGIELVTTHLPPRHLAGGMGGGII